MASDLPNDFDVIVMGTGLPESILAAAFSRIGLKVLHIDRNDYYSANWASFNLQGIEKWKSEQADASCYETHLDEEKVKELVKSGEKAVELPKTFPTVYDPKSSFHVGERPKSDPPVSSVASAEQKQTNAPKDGSSTGTATEDGDGVTQTPDAAAESSKEASKAPVEDVGAVGDSAGAEPGQFDSASEDEAGSEGKKQNEGASTTKESDKDGNAADQQSTQKAKCEWFADDIQKEWRRFSLDLSPKLLYCAGSMVELLIASDVAKYCEFRTVSRVLTVRDNTLEKVPCSRADVFASKAISLPEKRLLMKFLTFAAEYEQHPEDYQEFLGKPFVEFLKSKKLSPKIQHFVLHSIAMATHTTTTEQGLASIQKFLRSLGRYGNTAFLFPLYGSGEIPQAFCRLSAVFGGCYVLTLSASHIIVNEENKCVGVLTSAGQRIDCKYLIADPSYVPETFYSAPSEKKISRGIFITDKTIFPSDEEELSLLQLPAEEGKGPTTVLELPPSSMVTPRNLYVVHLTRPSESDPHTDLSKAVSALFNEQPSDAADEETSKPQVLWSLYFQQRDLSAVTAKEDIPSNMFVVTGPGSELDMDRCVAEARNIFKVICPEEEFLPKPPHPDDIIYVDDEQTTAGTGSEWGADATQNVEEVSGGSQPTGPDSDTDKTSTESAAVERLAEKPESSGSPESAVGGAGDGQSSEAAGTVCSQDSKSEES